VKHLVLHTEGNIHVSRLKPFFGSMHDAIAMAKHDQNQFTIQSINYFTGNPNLRSSMSFNITFEDGTTSMLRYGDDFIHSEQFDHYIKQHPILFPLRFPAKTVPREIAKMERLTITDVQPGMEAFVDFRIYDGQNSAWFDSLDLPVKTKPYTTQVNFTKWHSPNHCVIVGTIPFFPPNHPKHTLWFSAYDIMAFVHLINPYWDTVLLNESDRPKFPKILEHSD